VTAKTFAERVLAGARRRKREYDQVQGIATTVTLWRTRALMLLAVPLHSAFAVWFGHFQAPPGQGKLQTWADALTWLQGGVALGLLVCGLMAHALLRGQRGGGYAGVAVQTAFVGIYLAFGAAAAIQDVAIGNGISTFLVICMGTAVLSLMRPAFSALVFGAAFVVFWVVLRASTLDSTLLASLQIQAIAVVLIAQLISAMMWHQYTRTVLLQRELELSNAALLAKQQELETLAERDTLTGLYNRRKFMALAAQELGRADRVPSGICVLMVDLDFFKQINDQYGHPVGDQVLQQVAARLLVGVRNTDTVARMGGEEFIVLIPGTQRAGALALAEKLRLGLRERPLQLAERTVPITASFGVTGLGPHQRASMEALYAAADQALYVAKKQGRDRVEWVEPLVTETVAGFSAVRTSGTVFAKGHG
jgi:diguanylate cyclase (GGDEF)-like protein